ncbi:DUF3618 domain-containing protein [Actinotalea sp. BY-33]|uniref:DUF3618 domain-containing protein n=1 Tax=Actinotalea soli TaxID=2819234 RepID=A0A939LRF1_9CELL|nr:DUF3618 domain-containing protein [Actinotalea soli]MBO1753171.1 DUF3618 domain-containing protein [Actinotalea soli]
MNASTTAASSSSEEDKHQRTPQQIEAEIARTRQELRLTVDELSDRLDPRTQATLAVDEVKAAVAEVKRKVSGESRPLGEPEPTTRAWVILGTGAAAAVGLVASIIRKL